MLAAVTDSPPEGLEAKDVYSTMAGETPQFETKDAAVPGYVPAAVPNTDFSNGNHPDQQAAEGDEKEAAAAPESDSGSGSSRKTTSRSSGSSGSSKS
jgi:hypothetical protein